MKILELEVLIGKYRRAYHAHTEWALWSEVLNNLFLQPNKLFNYNQFARDLNRS